MIFYRSPHSSGAKVRTIASIRWLVVVALAGYPAGALIRALAADTLQSAILGFGLILVSLVAAMILFGTQLGRVTGEERDRLDEYELSLRAQAMEVAYGALSGALLLAMIYFAIGSDKGWWIPSGYEQWNAVFWGVFLYATLLPTAVLSFRLRPDEGVA
jgi:uncharacterized membrane protein